MALLLHAKQTLRTLDLGRGEYQGELDLRVGIDYSDRTNLKTLSPSDLTNLKIQVGQNFVTLDGKSILELPSLSFVVDRSPQERAQRAAIASAALTAGCSVFVILVGLILGRGFGISITSVIVVALCFFAGAFYGPVLLRTGSFASLHDLEPELRDALKERLVVASHTWLRSDPRLVRIQEIGRFETMVLTLREVCLKADMEGEILVAIPSLPDELELFRQASFKSEPLLGETQLVWRLPDPTTPVS